MADTIFIVFSNFKASTMTASSLAQYDAKKAESDLEKHVSDIIGTSDRLEQDAMEGVDENDWVSQSIELRAGGSF